MKQPEEKKTDFVSALKDAAKKIYEKPAKTGEQESIASKSSCGTCGGCGELVKKF